MFLFNDKLFTHWQPPVDDNVFGWRKSIDFFLFCSEENGYDDDFWNEMFAIFVIWALIKQNNKQKQQNDDYYYYRQKKFSSSNIKHMSHHHHHQKKKHIASTWTVHKHHVISVCVFSLVWFSLVCSNISNRKKLVVTFYHASNKQTNKNVSSLWQAQQCNVINDNIKWWWWW